MPANLKGGYRSKNGMVTYGKVKKYKPGGENKSGLKKLVKMAKDNFGITAKRGKDLKYPGGGSYMGPGMSMRKPERKNMAYGGGMGPMNPGEKEKKVMGYGGSHMGMKNMDPRIEAAKFRKRK